MGRHGENIRKRKDGRWEARYIQKYNSEGKAVYRYVYRATIEEGIIYEGEAGWAITDVKVYPAFDDKGGYDSEKELKDFKNKSENDHTKFFEITVKEPETETDTPKSSGYNFSYSGSQETSNSEVEHQAD